jgi:hypothetical protein
MKLGAEDKKKVYALAVLGVVAVIAFYTQVIDTGSSSTPSTPRPAATAAAPDSPAPTAMPTAAPTPSPADPAPRASKKLITVSRGEDFRPALHSKRPEDRIDPLTVDPTLRTDLLAKVQDVKPEGGSRNLFQFGAAAPKEVLKGPEQKIPVIAKVYDYPRPKPPDPPKAAEPPPPPEPPIDLKYYGVATKTINGKKTALFLDGENTLLAPEGSIVKKKYKVVRIGPSSVVMENTENKKQQTLQISEDAGASLSN